jgi:hypothetical protein
VSGAEWIAVVLGGLAAGGLLLRYLTRHDHGYVVVAWEAHRPEPEVVGCHSRRRDARRHAARLRAARVLHVVGPAWHQAQRGVVPSPE